VPIAQALVEALATLADESIGGAQVFSTNTFRDPPPRPGSPYFTSVGHAGGVRALERWLVGAAEVYPGLAAFFAMEPHADRVAPHFHGLLAGLGDDVAAAVDAGRRRPRGGDARVGVSIGARHARERLWQSWFDANGIARMESCDGNGAGLYVAKYSLKGGDDVPWWRIWEPGELRNEWVARSGRKGRTR